MWGGQQRWKVWGGQQRILRLLFGYLPFKANIAYNKSVNRPLDNTAAVIIGALTSCCSTDLWGHVELPCAAKVGGVEDTVPLLCVTLLCKKKIIKK